MKRLVELALAHRRVATALLAGMVLLLAWLFWPADALESRYRSEPAAVGNIEQTVSANGTLNPVTLVSVGTQVSGQVRSIHADYNDRVTKDQVLMRLDDSVLAASLRQSEANLAAANAALGLARTNLQRLQPLLAEGFVSAQEHDTARQAMLDAEARAVQAKAQVDRDRTNLDYSVIRSPVSGVVVARVVDVGQTVAASFNTPELFRIAADLTEMQIDAYFAEADVGRIRVGQAVKFRVDAFPDDRFRGSVKQIRLNPKTESNVVTYDVVVAVKNPDGRLLPGMTAYVDVTVAEKNDVLRVPNAALRFRPAEAEEKTTENPAGGLAQGLVRSALPAGPGMGRPQARDKARRGGDAGEGTGTVYVLEGDVLRAVVLKTGIADKRYTEVLEGLQPGAAVVLEDTSPPAEKRSGGGFSLGF